VTWFVTANNALLNGDTTRRTLHIRLESPEEQPEHRTTAQFRHPNIVAHVRAHRPALVHAALTILRAYVVAGRPDMRLSTWGSFEAWSVLVRNARVWSGAPDPGDTRKELREQADSDSAALEQLVAGWADVAAIFDGECTVAQALSELGKSAAGLPLLRAALAELVPTKDGRPPPPHRVGKTLQKFRNRIVGGRAIVKVSNETGRHGVVWAVREVTAGGNAGGLVGSGGVVSTLRGRDHAGENIEGSKNTPPDPPIPPTTPPEFDPHSDIERQPGEEG